MPKKQLEIGKDDQETLIDILAPFLTKGEKRVEIVMAKDGSIICYQSITKKRELFRMDI